jgi:hypothetical protein
MRRVSGEILAAGRPKKVGKPPELESHEEVFSTTDDEILAGGQIVSIEETTRRDVSDRQIAA